MRLPASAHTSRPWRIHRITPDFRVEDVWALPTPGGPEDFPRLVTLLAAGELSRGSSGAAGMLWTIRRRLGKVLGWDGPDTGVGARVLSLGDRLPADLRERHGPDLGRSFRSLYLLDDEWAAELAGRHVHAVLHVGWVGEENGAHRGRLAVLVRPDGRVGKAYMAAIRPFRERVVFPAMLRAIERDWRSTAR